MKYTVLTKIVLQNIKFWCRIKSFNIALNSSRFALILIWRPNMTFEFLPFMCFLNLAIKLSMYDFQKTLFKIFFGRKIMNTRMDRLRIEINSYAYKIPAGFSECKLVRSLVALVATSTRVSFESLAPTRSPVDADWSSASD